MKFHFKIRSEYHFALLSPSMCSEFDGENSVPAGAFSKKNFCQAKII